MRTKPHPASQRRTAYVQNDTSNLNQVSLPQKRKAPDTSAEQLAENPVAPARPVKISFRPQLASADQINPSTSSVSDNAAAHSRIRLRFTARGLVPDSSEQLHPDRSVGPAGPAQGQSGVANINSAPLECGEPALKRRKTLEDDRFLSDKDTRMKLSDQKDIDHYIAGKFREAVEKIDSSRVGMFILSRTVKIDTLDNYSRAKALLMMVSSGNREAVRILISSGVYTKIFQSGEGASHLISAARRGDWRMVRAVLNSAPGNGSELHHSLINLLHLALRNGDCASAKALLRAGVSPKLVSRSGETALAVVAKSIVSRHANYLRFSSTIDPPYLQLIALLISAGAEINQPLDDSGATLLHKAVEYRYVQHIGWLLLKGADPQIKNAAQQTPLDLAIAQGDYLALRALGVEPNARASGKPLGMSPLALLDAAVRGDAGYINALDEVVDLDINCQDAHGDTPLMLALTNDHLQAAEQLLSRGANPYIVRPGTRASAFTIAAMKGQTRILSLLTNTPEFFALKDITGVDALCAAVEREQVEAVKLLRTAGVSVYVIGPGGKSAATVNQITSASRQNRELQFALQ